MIFALLTFGQYLLFVLILAFLVVRSSVMGEKSSSQASSGHIVELHKSCIQMFNETVGRPVRIK